MAEVELYTTMFCPYCARARALLERKGVAYTEIDIIEEPARRVHADEIALGGELSEKSGGHGRQSPFGHLNCLSAGMLKGLVSEEAVNS